MRPGSRSRDAENSSRRAGAALEVELALPERALRMSGLGPQAAGETDATLLSPAAERRGPQRAWSVSIPPDSAGAEAAGVRLARELVEARLRPGARQPPVGIGAQPRSGAGPEPGA